MDEIRSLNVIHWRCWEKAQWDELPPCLQLWRERRRWKLFLAHHFAWQAHWKGQETSGLSWVVVIDSWYLSPKTLDSLSKEILQHQVPSRHPNSGCSWSGRNAWIEDRSRNGMADDSVGCQREQKYLFLCHNFGFLHRKMSCSVVLSLLEIVSSATCTRSDLNGCIALQYQTWHSLRGSLDFFFEFRHW